MSLYPSSEMSKVPYHEQQPYEPPPPYAPETGPSAPAAMVGPTGKFVSISSKINLNFSFSVQL